MERIISAELVAQGVNAPERLAEERAKAVAAAGPGAPARSNAELLEYGRRMVADIDRARLVS